MTPSLIPLPKAREFTGMTPMTLHRINRDEAPGIVRQRGQGRQRRYYLHVETWNRYISRLRAAE